MNAAYAAALNVAFLSALGWGGYRVIAWFRRQDRARRQSNR